MLKKIYDAVRALLALVLDAKRTQDDVKELRQEVDRLATAVLRLTYEFQRLDDRERAEREKLALQLENQLLRFERQPPQPPSRKLADGASESEG